MTTSRDAERPTPDSRHVETVDGHIHFLEAGRGPTLLLLHPAAGTSFFFTRLIGELQDDFRLVAPDLPGFGRSRARDGRVPGHPGGAGDPFGLRRTAGFLNRFVEALDLPPCGLLLTDTGGPLGLAAAAREPERYDRLILADTFGFPLGGRFAPVRTMLARVLPSAPFRALNRRLNLLPFAVSTLAPFRNPLSRAERRRYRAQFPTPESRSRIVDLFAALGRDRAFLEELERGIRRSLSGHDALLVFGRHDPVRLLGFETRFRELFPSATSVVIPREEHFPVLGSPGPVAAAIRRWWRVTAPGPGSAAPPPDAPPSRPAARHR